LVHDDPAFYKEEVA